MNVKLGVQPSNADEYASVSVIGVNPTLVSSRRIIHDMVNEQ